MATHLNARRSAGTITEIRDNALITVGCAYAQINAALLVALTAQRLSAAGDEAAQLWGCAVKAHGVDATWLSDRGRTAAQCTQADLDAWHAEHRLARRAAQQFLRWCMRTGNMPRLSLPVTSPSATRRRSTSIADSR